MLYASAPFYKIERKMPQHHPEDRVRVRNIVKPDGDDVQTLFLTRKRKESYINSEGQSTTRETTYEQEVQWNFLDGFFFMWGGKAYLLKPGEQRTYPRFIAEHCVKHQVQHVLNDRYEKSKRMASDGTYKYDQNILKNQVLRKRLRDEAVVGVEDWYEADESDFDTLVSRKFGGDVEDLLGEQPSVDKGDTLIENDFEDDAPSLLEQEESGRKAVKMPATRDKDLQAARTEAEMMSVPYEPSDTAEQVKAKLLKSMA